MKRVKFGVSRHFLENPLRKWPDIVHADVSWQLSELIRLWLQFVDFSNFDAILTFFWSNMGFPGIFVVLCGFSSLWWPFGWNWSYLGFLGSIWRTCGSKCRGEGGGIFPRWVLSSFFWSCRPVKASRFRYNWLQLFLAICMLQCRYIGYDGSERCSYSDFRISVVRRDAFKLL